MTENSSMHTKSFARLILIFGSKIADNFDFLVSLGKFDRELPQAARAAPSDANELLPQDGV
ncbi:predicted protein [Botrytis cinerea T4]|uniref:Uncharacterized protein n=1 Tax=Botryotinia fuckeliana (strain T4) TaxID=999810 RepID=G2YNP8_BOTF4|nr:predicted protein [Botrytis cinerea T4]